MKQKKNLYFLIPAVLVIWGIIIYRIVDFTAEGEVDFTPRTYTRQPLENKVIEAYQLKPSYPDPFLKKTRETAEPEPDNESLLRSATLPPTEKVVEAPMNIQYRGFINESGTRKRIALLVIEGEEVFLKRGEQFGTFMVGDILEDSVGITRNQKRRWIRKD